jgi:hypothetical protein
VRTNAKREMHVVVIELAQFPMGEETRENEVTI